MGLVEFLPKSYNTLLTVNTCSRGLLDPSKVSSITLTTVKFMLAIVSYAILPKYAIFWSYPHPFFHGSSFLEGNTMRMFSHVSLG